MTWAFILEQIGTVTTHLITRTRAETLPKWAECLMANVIYQPIHGIMSDAQLKHIRSLAERDARIR